MRRTVMSVVSIAATRNCTENQPSDIGGCDLHVHFALLLHIIYSAAVVTQSHMPHQPISDHRLLAV